MNQFIRIVNRYLISIFVSLGEEICYIYLRFLNNTLHSSSDREPLILPSYLKFPDPISPYILDKQLYTKGVYPNCPLPPLFPSTIFCLL